MKIVSNIESIPPSCTDIASVTRSAIEKADSNIRFVHVILKCKYLNANQLYSRSFYKGSSPNMHGIGNYQIFVKKK